MPSVDPTGALLERVRALEEAQDFQALVRELRARDRAELLAEPALGLALAIALRVVGEPGEALTLVRDLAPHARSRGPDRVDRRLLNLHGALRFERGDVEEAQTLWETLLDQASRAGDVQTQARASNNLGVLHTLQGRPEQALAAYARARAACLQLGDRRGLAQAYQNLAINYRESGFEADAHAHFALAADHAGRAQSSEDVLGRVEEERALLFLTQGDHALADRYAGRALERLTALGDRAGQGEALRVLGMIDLVRGRPEPARARLDQAVELARATGSALLEAETLEALAALEGRQRRAAEAGALADAAAALFRRLRAEAWGERVRRRIRSLLEPDGPGPDGPGRPDGPGPDGPPERRDPPPAA